MTKDDFATATLQQVQHELVSGFQHVFPRSEIVSCLLGIDNIFEFEGFVLTCRQGGQKTQKPEPFGSGL